MDAARSKSYSVNDDVSSNIGLQAFEPDPHFILVPFLSGAKTLAISQAEEAVLSWLVLRQDGVDPAWAATELLARTELSQNAGSERLQFLLKEISLHQVGQQPSKRRRRRRADA